MRVSLIFTILLIGTAVLAADTENPLSLVLSQVSDQPFGNAIGALIQMHLKSQTEAPNGQVNAILNLLNNLNATIQKAKDNAEVRYESKAAWCSDTISQLEKEYEAAKKASAQSSGDYNELTREQGVKKNDLTSSTASKADLREDLTKAANELEQENTVFSQRSADYSEAIAACQEAIRLLLSLGNRNANSASFIQMNQSFGNIKNKLEKHAKNSSNSAFIEPILDVLSQLANGATYDYSKITGIVDLIRSLLKNLQSSEQELESNHGKVANDLQELIANLSNQLDNVQVNIDVFDTRLNEIEVRLNELKPLIDQYDLLVQVNGKMLEGTKSDCQDNDALYAEQQAAREKQLSIIARLTEYFENESKGRN